MDLPEEFVRNITEAFPEGPEWLEQLPETLNAAAGHWQLSVGEAVPNLSFNYVCFTTLMDGTPAVLKLGVPRDEFAQEIAALHFYGGRGAVRLIDSDSKRGWLLLERVLPGTPLTALEDDEEATRILAETLLRLWAPPPEGHSFPPLADSGRGFASLRRRYGGTGPFPADLVARAEASFLRPVAEPVLLHADFHHDNVLRGDGEWIIIDPKGMTGERLYDVGVLLYNPFPVIRTHSRLEQLMAKRVAIVAEVLAADVETIIEWGIAAAILSAWWTMEGRPDGEPLPVEVRLAEVLAGL